MHMGRKLLIAVIIAIGLLATVGLLGDIRHQLSVLAENIGF